MNNIFKNFQQKIGNRSGPNDPLPDDYPTDCLQIEEQLVQLREACAASIKRLDACMQTKNSDRYPNKKLPEYGLSLVLADAAASFQEKSELMHNVFQESASVEEALAQHRCDFERDLEKSVIEPMKRLADQQLTELLKDRTRLSKQHQDLVGLLSRLEAAHEDNARRRLEEEFDDKQQRMRELKNKVQRAMYDFQYDCKRHADYFLTLLKLQHVYHQHCTEALEMTIPKLQASIENVTQYRLPVYGILLTTHLNETNRTISYVLQTCVEWLLSDGRAKRSSTAAVDYTMSSSSGGDMLLEEGIFRISGGKLQVSALITAFNTMCAEEMLAKCDVHTVTGALKQYFRDLPDCLLWTDLYDRWNNAVLHTEHNQRMEALYECCQILKSQRGQHYLNLRYLLQFLTCVSRSCERNKMKNSNLGIVFGPTLLFPKRSLNGFDNMVDATMLASGNQGAVIEHLLTYFDYFFKDELVTLASAAAAAESKQHSQSSNGSSSFTSSTVSVKSVQSTTAQSTTSGVCSAGDMLNDQQNFISNDSSESLTTTSSDKRFHTDFYDTLFALQSLRNDALSDSAASPSSNCNNESVHRNGKLMSGSLHGSLHGSLQEYSHRARCLYEREHFLVQRQTSVASVTNWRDRASCGSSPTLGTGANGSRRRSECSAAIHLCTKATDSATWVDLPDTSTTLSTAAAAVELLAATTSTTPSSNPRPQPPPVPFSQGLRNVDGTTPAKTPTLSANPSVVSGIRPAVATRPVVFSPSSTTTKSTKTTTSPTISTTSIISTTSATSCSTKDNQDFPDGSSLVNGATSFSSSSGSNTLTRSNTINTLRKKKFAPAPPLPLGAVTHGPLDLGAPLASAEEHHSPQDEVHNSKFVNQRSNISKPVASASNRPARPPPFSKTTTTTNNNINNSSSINDNAEEEEFTSL